MIKFVIRFVIFALFTAIGSFWAMERFSSARIVGGIAQAVMPMTPIADLIRAPEKYDGSLVQISGRPIPHLKLAGLGFGGFVIEDESGNKMVVLTKSGIPVMDPATGRITVLGMYKKLFEIGTLFYPVVVSG